MDKDMKLLEVKDLTVHYVTYDGTVCAVENLNLKLNYGETLGLVGETGAGKTTTAKAIMGLLPQPPAEILSGEIIFEGQDILNKPESELEKIRGNKISMVFQDPMTSLNPVISVGKQIQEVILLHQDIERSAVVNKAKEMLELVGIPAERSSDFPHQFSGGMRQRVVIAMALACNPKLLIADEPTTALDVTIQAQVLDLMKGLKTKYNTSTIMITHDLGVVADICDKIAVIYAGNVVEYADKLTLFTKPQHPYTIGLFNCIPDIYSEEKRLTPIKGLMPDPTNLPKGCRFWPRCPNVKEICSQKEPPVAAIESNHFIKCHLFS